MRVRALKLVSTLASAGAVAALLAAAACSSSGGGGGNSAGASGSASGASCSSTVAGYCDLVAAAKTEGKLTVLSGPEGVGDDGDFFNAFGAAFGIKVTIVGGAADEVNSKILAERQQGQYTADISSQGDSGTQRLLKAKAFQPLEPEIIDPSLKDRSSSSTWRLTYFPWEDPDTKTCTDIALEADINFAPIFYNTKLVKGADLDGITSWDSLLDPKWKGKIEIGDIGAGEDNSDAAELWLGVGQDWFGKLLKDQKPHVLPYGSQRQQADDLANGKYAIGLFPPGADALQEAIDQKLPIAQMDRTMSEGTSAKAIQRMCVLDKPKDPAAAKLFVNWSLSKDGQTAFNQKTKRTDRVALRADVPQGNIAASVWNQANSVKPETLIDVNSAAYRKAIDDEEAFSKKAEKDAGITP
jgi:ABC-type Fe3+ transport system substrate-binding protein